MLSNSDSKAIGAQLAAQDQGKQPDRYGCFDTSSPIEVLERIRAEVPAPGSKQSEHVYLNPDWKEEYGGSFEVWTDDISAKIARFAPVMNRMCCFSTGDDTMHGNPEPVSHPEGQPRLSIALHGYTATWKEGRIAQSTVFKRRPGSGDARSNEAVLRVARDVLPPFVCRNSLRVLRKRGINIGH